MNNLDFQTDDSTRPVKSVTIRRLRYGKWLFKLVAWDGLLPAVVLLVPHIVRRLFPHQRDAIEFAAIGVPIASFLIRFYVARREIYSNHCTRWVRATQLVALCVAIFILLLVDSFIILITELPNGALCVNEQDLIVLIVFGTLYLSCMAFALYPGMTDDVSTIEWRDVDPFQDLSS